MALIVQVRQIKVAETKTTELRFIKAEASALNTILILPALGVPASYYDRLMKSLARMGRSCAVIDLQGQGKSSVKASKRSNYGYRDILIEDIPSAINAVTNLFDSPVDLLGHSLGGQLACLYCTLLDERVSGLILCTSGSVYYWSWPGWQKLSVLSKSQFARLYAWIVGYFPGAKFGFGGDTFQKLIDDWGRQALTGKYKLAGSSFNWDQRLRKVTLPVLAIHLDSDFLAPPGAVRHLCNKLTSAKQKICYIENSALDHFNWLRRPDVFIEAIESWYGQIHQHNYSTP
ncbi:alpha/beta fold hydrolase [Mucilaginibacter jinjuensis]|uniref:Alpha/beta fold hydrolase n=1 Tax=Mucilaginibacter jinjuensis TaxID=1176721 RepID=A0ABY7T8D4_9SPHI|nr:alpha/beta fold hydrolase [Mucilaginibacter jinjuensis]WCT12543.1 alpha/beta fold hydrolase [Mucilaginibacter jinjuensis]